MGSLNLDALVRIFCGFNVAVVLYSNRHYHICLFNRNMHIELTISGGACSSGRDIFDSEIHSPALYGLSGKNISDQIFQADIKY